MKCVFLKLSWLLLLLLYVGVLVRLFACLLVCLFAVFVCLFVLQQPAAATAALKKNNHVTATCYGK